MRRSGGWVSTATVGYLGGVGAWRSLVARTVRVGEVPSSNLGAPIKNPRKSGVFCWAVALLVFAQLGSEQAVRAFLGVSIRPKAACVLGFAASALSDEFDAVYGC